MGGAGQTGHGDQAGRSIIEMIWEQLDEAVNNLHEPEVTGNPFGHALLKGRALGLAEALAVLQSPYAPDVDEIRAQAASRYEARAAQGLCSGHSGPPSKAKKRPVRVPRRVQEPR
jgi:hypothetical protein